MRLAHAREPIVPIPPVVVPVDVHLALVAVAVEDRVAYVRSTTRTTVS